MAKTVWHPARMTLLVLSFSGAPVRFGQGDRDS